MVESGILLRCRPGNGTEGSNPSLSAGTSENSPCGSFLMYLLVGEGFEGYSKNANCFAFFETRALEEKFLLCPLARKISGEEESLPHTNFCLRGESERTASLTRRIRTTEHVQLSRAERDPPAGGGA